MRTLEDVDVAGKPVVVRVDFNVPLSDGQITDDTRIRAALPTLRELRDRGAARLVLLAHLGRPEGRDAALSLAPVARRLGELLGTPVALADQPDPPLPDAPVVMVENVRFFDGETKDDEALARRYAALGEVFVDDAFGAAHRAHSSTHGVARLLPSAAGRLLEREVQTLTGILRAPPRPLVAIIGGAKVTDKIGVLDAFLDTADAILIGGAMCFPFLYAQGHSVGGSLCEQDGIPEAKRLLHEAREADKADLVLPADLLLGRDFSADTEVRSLDGVDVPEGWMGLDIGPRTAQAYGERIAAAGSVFWNGPQGAVELEPFAAGTRTVAEAVAEAGRGGTVTVVGGGDSAAALTQFGLADAVTHLSTGGGASLELIEGKTLPGVEVLA